MEYTIDAKGKAIGRIASQAATLLMGKNKANFEKNKIALHKVFIINASKVKINEKKSDTTFHEKYSKYPGGFKLLSVKKIAASKGYAELFKLAVYGMLPANRLRNKIMKNLKISE
ncbi:MAG TPA: 50S ribosomal protein L13 [Candidatus Paceibacterota bacterium]